MQIRRTYKYKVLNSKKNKHLTREIENLCFVYNHCIALHRRYYRLFKKGLTESALKKHITKIKKTHKKEWKNLPSQAIQDVVERIDKAYKLFFSNIKKKIKSAPPGFKKRIKYKSFTLKQGVGYSLFQEESEIKIKDRIYKYHNSRPITGVIKTLTVKRDNKGQIFLCFSVVDEIENRIQTEFKTGRIAGFDFGLKTFLVSSDGESIESPLFLKQSMKALKKASKNVSTKKKGSKNRKKAISNLNSVYTKISNQRKDFLMKKARELALSHDVLLFEDLTLKGMQKLYGRKISDLAFGEFLTYLQYFCALFDKKIVFINRFYPSSKTCNCCGHKKEDLTLKDREWNCVKCGTKHDRDINAAINIKNEGLRMIENENIVALEENKKEKPVGTSTGTREEVRPLANPRGIL